MSLPQSPCLWTLLVYSFHSYDLALQCLWLALHTVSPCLAHIRVMERLMHYRLLYWQLKSLSCSPTSWPSLPCNNFKTPQQKKNVLIQCQGSCGPWCMGKWRPPGHTCRLEWLTKARWMVKTKEEYENGLGLTWLCGWLNLGSIGAFLLGKGLITLRTGWVFAQWKVPST